MKKRINKISIILLLILILQPFSGYAQDRIQDANLVIGRNYKVPVLQAGNEERLSIPIENTTSGEAYSIYVSPIIDDPAEFPFVIDQMIPSRRIAAIAGKTRENVHFNFQVRSNIEPKTYPIQFNIEYTLPSGNIAKTSETIYIQIENDQEVPNLRLNLMKMAQDKLVAGQNQPVTLTIENTGDLVAKNIEVQLTGVEANGISLITPIDTHKIDQMEGKEKKEVFYTIVADDNLEDGTYVLDLIMKYKDEYNKAYEGESKVRIPVVASSSVETSFSLEKLNYPETAIEPHTDFTISFDLKNTGAEDAQKVKVSIDGGEGILPKSMPIKNIGNLVAGKQQPVEFTLFAKEGIEDKNYPIQITVEYETDSGRTKEMKSFEQYVGVFVKDKKTSAGAPKIIVDQYDYDGEYVKAGEPFDLTVSFLNTNHEKTVKNIRVSISSTGDVFAPVTGSNSFFISEITSQGSTMKNISLRPKVDAEYDTHNLFIDIEYEDDQGEAYSVKEMVGIPVVQNVTLMIDEVMTSPENYSGNPTALSVEFYNTGRALIRNLVIRTEGDIDITEGSLYIGNLEPGKNNYYDVTVTPREPGTTTGRMIFEYDDEIDQHYVVEKEFSIEVMDQMEMYPPDDFGEFEEFNEQSNSPMIRIVVGGGMLLLVIGGFVWRRRKKRRAEAEEVEAYE
ncbi:S-layer domain-like protein [Alkaliphilus metalliredigens QYMF]|uniref:S-layer domain-like protein n=1 Tax=Alkaliphilus metalliredigens (strain QYMF) TaxID=293826 RepID=A6TK79_ALKMQ|nr:S-layer protein [Alkaliphilus metalliredigens]ABR46597.1 S-layer domain-like protein [Alkaliphilus metalliredigens QYMF]